jgi:hypothetical protein
MANLIGQQHEVRVSAELGRQNVHQPTLPERSGISSDSNDGKDNGGCSKGKEERKTSHVKKKPKNHGELAMAEWGKKNNLLTA